MRNDGVESCLGQNFVNDFMCNLTQNLLTQRVCVENDSQRLPYQISAEYQLN